MRPIAAVVLCVVGGAGLTLFALLRPPVLDDTRDLPRAEGAEAAEGPQLRQVPAERAKADVAPDIASHRAADDDALLALAEASPDEDIRGIARLARMTASASVSERLLAADSLVDAAELGAALGFEPQPYLDRLARDPEVRVQKRLLKRVLPSAWAGPSFDTRTRREMLVALSGSPIPEVSERALAAIDLYAERRPETGALDTAAGRRSWISSAAARPVTSAADGWTVIDVELSRQDPVSATPRPSYRLVRGVGPSLQIVRRLGGRRVRIWRRPLPVDAMRRVFPLAIT